jgi:hypothetical protein
MEIDSVVFWEKHHSAQSKNEKEFSEEFVLVVQTS